jgi:hypothetical protein
VPMPMDVTVYLIRPTGVDLQCSDSQPNDDCPRPVVVYDYDFRTRFSGCCVRNSTGVQILGTATALSNLRQNFTNISVASLLGRPID